MKKVKIGSVGLGRLGYEHARNLATLIPGCELAALCDVAEEQAKKVAEELGVPNVYTDFEEMCKNPELDAIAIVTPSFLHTAQIATAMKYGKHVFCEKPLGTDVAQCKEAEKVIEQYPDLIFQLGFMRRFDKSYAEAKKKVDAGVIGKVVLVRSYTQDPRSMIESTLKFAPHSGGQFLDMCVHDIDLIRWFTGANVKNVWGLGGVFEFDLYREPHAPGRLQRGDGDRRDARHAPHRQCRREEPADDRRRERRARGVLSGLPEPLARGIRGGDDRFCGSCAQSHEARGPDGL